jgi:hypothetical protein
MKKLIAMAVVLALAGGVQAAKKVAKAEPAAPTVKAEVSFELKGDVLKCSVHITGNSEKVSPVVYWTAPAFTCGSQEIKVFADGKHECSPCNHQTSATRQVVTELNGKAVRGVGVWKAVVKLDGVEIGSGEYEVK